MNGGADQPGPVIGRLLRADDKGVVRFETHFDTSAGDLWSALTKPDRLARWLGDVQGDLRVGGEFRAHFDTSGWEGVGRVEVCEPPHRLLVLTTGTEEQETHAIEATLTTDGQQTVLILEERGMPEEQLAAYGAGVQIHVEDLAAHLAGRERRETGAHERWTGLLPAYQGLAVGVRS